MESISIIINIWCLFFVNFGAVYPPNIDQVQYGINIFRGETPFEQRQNLVGDKLFSLTNTITSDDIGTFITHDQINEISSNAHCYYQSKSSKVSWSTSESTLQRQSTASSNGYDQQTTLGMEYKGFTAETSIRNALVFGNSQTSKNAYSHQSSGYTYSFDASSSRSLYNIEVDWENFDSNYWDNDFKSDIVALGSNPSINSVLNFWLDYGTHGLLTASFGQSCTASVFMEQGGSKTQYESLNSETSSTDVGLLWWSSTSSSTQEDGSTEMYENTFEYFFGNRYCYGELNYQSSCGATMQASGITSPAITRWTYKPIWEMDIPNFSSGGKSKMKSIAQGIYDEANNCRINNCNNHGHCQPNINAWSGGSISITSSSQYYQLWNTDKCFCDDTYRGNRCQYDALLELRYDSFTGYVNNWDGTLDYTSPNAICGIKGVHDNGREDRRYGFKPCRPVLTNYDTPIGSYQVIPTTSYDAAWSIQCDKDKILRKIYSTHNNGREDRIWTFYCQQLERTTTTNCIWDSSWRNWWDATFEESCKSGFVIHGLSSYHDNNREDRRWKFQCCEMTMQNILYKAISKTGWTGYINNWDSSHTTDVSSQNRVFCGFSSYHSNSREDRRYRLKYCYQSGTSLTGLTGWSGYTNWDAYWSHQCSDGRSFIVAMNSYHSNSREDRRFRFRCARFNGATTGDCTTYEYVNYWDASFNFECGPNYAIRRIQSYHDNGREDRRFRFQCCRIGILQ